MKARFPIWTCVAAGAAIIGLAGMTELALGRRVWGKSGQPGIWSGDVWSEHNSQYLADPYTFSHITHGVLLYGLLWLAAGRLPCRLRALLALVIESAWEVIENTDTVIERYRATTMSLNYYGDSVMNSMFDILACMAGFLIAYLLPARVMLIGVVVLEIMLALWIRDSLFLNILMLLRPIHAIREWQLEK
jgi:uncharacterized protein DUF2585